ETTSEAVEEAPLEPAEAPVGSDIDPASAYVDPDRFVPMTDEEMEEELDAIEADEESAPAEPAQSQSPVETKLQQVQQYRAAGDLEQARELLYEILQDGNSDQRMVARNILAQLDSED
ncbi:MAG: twin-arginine translocase subunit TatC, partial [Candidatus Thiodiazotropha taylori]|nr:twin-arginine translocase subunit TatC [Candidatus Thiodiazotropha taylori]